MSTYEPQRMKDATLVCHHHCYSRSYAVQNSPAKELKLQKKIPTALNRPWITSLQYKKLSWCRQTRATHL